MQRGSGIRLSCVSAYSASAMMEGYDKHEHTEHDKGADHE